MATVSDVLHALEQVCPSHLAYPWDRIGLQVGDPKAEVRSAVVSLDPSRAAVAYAAGRAQMLVSHHPVVWDPLARLCGSWAAERAGEMVRAGLAFAAAHTNWDCALGGVNDALAGRLGLRDVRPAGAGPETDQLKLVVYVPRASTQALLDALSEAGAGRIGAYRRCAFWTAGTGTFQPLEGANPAVGKVGEVEEVEEDRLEALLPGSAREAVVAAIRAHHPYEEPAFDFSAVSRPGLPPGRVGALPRPMTSRELAGHVEQALATRAIVYGSEEGLGELAVVGGAAGAEWRHLGRPGVAFLTGEAPHHIGVEAADAGCTLVVAGHYATEQPGAEALCQALRQALPGVEFETFVPDPGVGGRPL